ncbi:hypothetical protein Thiowin_03743 [Thiorhodovibrio winogradskyi]|uniref:Uncharacterized protein n=1 Tax=Thiorhodovibrio winogradskyi TaxID=77007 RepID=A0ABZ0SDK6_9GAMM|nr:hypothetical protein [Thiorhodovibrio winogradskyi]
MDGETLQALELIGWFALMYWLLTATKSARKAASEAREQDGDSIEQRSGEDANSGS